MTQRTVGDRMRESSAPEDVELRAVPAEPYDDPTMGIAVSVKRKGRPKNRLVVIGDSLSHGFQSGAIHNTDLSWPAVVAHEMGIRDFRYPSYNGYGGLPLNIEWLLHELEGAFGDRLNWWELGRAAVKIRHLMDEVEDWWERGRGAHISKQQAVMHNLSVYGFDLRDALSYSADHCHRVIKKHMPRDQYFKQIVENAQQIAALRVLSNGPKEYEKLSPVELAERLGAEGGGDGGEETQGIEVLVVLLGANNALGSVVQLGRIRWSEDGYKDLERKQAYTVWRPSHFERELEELVSQIAAINARHVIIGNVPHVTIPPVARGVQSKYEPGSRYFPFYTRPWIRDEDFSPQNDPYITANEARYVDSAIDQYNAAIAKQVAAMRKKKKDWYLFDACGLLDRLATRRYLNDQLARPAWWTPYEMPDALSRLDPKPNCRFFRSGPRGRLDGGMFSLDGVHPTTIGYGIMAQEIINVMRLAEVPFYYQDGRTVRKQQVRVDFERLLTRDTLLSDPPRSLASNLDLMGWIDEKLDLFRRVLPFAAA